MLLEGYNLIMMAAETGDLEMLQRRLKSENINQRNTNGNCALIISVKNQRFEVAEMLLKHKAEVNATNNAGQSSLALACLQGWEEGVCLLIQYGADVNLSDKAGWSPLIITAHQNHLNIVKILLKHGADTKYRNNYGKRAVDKTSSQDIVQALLDSEIDSRYDQVQTALNINKKKISREGQGELYDYHDEIWQGVNRHALGDHTHDFITRHKQTKPKKQTHWKEDWTLENEYSLNSSYKQKPPISAQPKPLHKTNQPKQKIRRVSSDHTFNPTLALQDASTKLNKVTSSFLTPQARTIPGINLIKSPKNVSFTNSSGSIVAKPALKQKEKDDYKAQIILHLDKQVSQQSRALVSNTIKQVNNELTAQISKLEKLFSFKIGESLVSMNDTISESFSSIYSNVMNDISLITSGKFDEKLKAVQDNLKENTDRDYEQPIKIPKGPQKVNTENDKQESKKRRIPQNKPKPTLNTQTKSGQQNPKKSQIPQDQTQKVKADKNCEMPRKLPIPKPKPKQQNTQDPYTKKEYEVTINLGIPEDLSHISNTEKCYDLPKIIENPQELAHLSQESNAEIEHQQPNTIENTRQVPKPYPIVPKLNLSLI